ncbi:HlyU family transcriptional regulator [Devosia sp. 1566]|uniref:HlyU family transcriptional regulator n=1 Tax=Devosia sp. 1566 TaxID=2499144 RepID=UPI000FD9BD18|nr:HlyU family transcriptional regulator [Devosia sp. 1566]
MSFLSKLFGGGAKTSAEPAGDKVLGEESYKDFTIRAIEMRAGSEYQLAGTIDKDIGGALKTYRFVRADRMSSKDDLIAMALNKGRQIIDEQGENIFS